jgi:site-specific DNA recombinase
LQEPERVADEYKRRLAQAAAGAEKPEEVARVEKQIASLQRGIERLIDSYAEGFVEKGEFEPRITDMKQRMSQLKERSEAAVRTAERERDIRLVVSRLEDFSAKVSDGLDRLDGSSLFHEQQGIDFAGNERKSWPGYWVQVREMPRRSNAFC